MNYDPLTFKLKPYVAPPMPKPTPKIIPAKKATKGKTVPAAKGKGKGKLTPPLHPKAKGKKMPVGKVGGKGKKVVAWTPAPAPAPGALLYGDAPAPSPAEAPGALLMGAPAPAPAPTAAVKAKAGKKTPKAKQAKLKAKLKQVKAAAPAVVDTAEAPAVVGEVKGAKAGGKKQKKVEGIAAAPAAGIGGDAAGGGKAKGGVKQAAAGVQEGAAKKVQGAAAAAAAGIRGRGAEELWGSNWESLPYMPVVSRSLITPLPTTLPSHSDSASRSSSSPSASSVARRSDLVLTSAPYLDIVVMILPLTGKQIDLTLANAIRSKLQGRKVWINPDRFGTYTVLYALNPGEQFPSPPPVPLSAPAAPFTYNPLSSSLSGAHAPPHPSTIPTSSSQDAKPPPSSNNNTGMAWYYWLLFIAVPLLVIGGLGGCLACWYYGGQRRGGKASSLVYDEQVVREIAEVSKGGKAASSMHREAKHRRDDASVKREGTYRTDDDDDAACEWPCAGGGPLPLRCLEVRASAVTCAGRRVRARPPLSLCARVPSPLCRKLILTHRTLNPRPGFQPTFGRIQGSLCEKRLDSSLIIL